ncbi:type I-E CRISPR-associated protein Cas6/Cse3/CasE [Brevibacterium otitidis]|uniref:Type I-E CRISPR-associated protein Cas6/Cse3/CasE n=1 Tax=Brevibacterium otitidis TaxID=53364 RepID=A0ABV5X2G1_9MICO|nr:hypothetical protein GCM10023233_04580 [Brevibacterium otitidis]
MLHTITLTRHGTALSRNVQAAHGLMREAFNGQPHQWAQPRHDIIIARSITEPKMMRRYMSELTSRDEQATGKHVRFSFIGHPVRRRESSETVLEGTAAIEWARRQLTPALMIDEIAAQSMKPQRGYRWGRRLTLTAALFTGTGTIVDRGELDEMLSTGVGRARGYGFGLLIVADREKP